MNKKTNYLAYGFRQIPEVIAASYRFTHAEKLIISKVFDMMWMNKETKQYAGSAFPTNEYLQKWCHVSRNTIITCKNKVKEIGLFNIVKRWNNSDLWILNEIPYIMVKEFEDFVDEMQEEKSKKQMSNPELASILENMTYDEINTYMHDNPELGVLC